MTGSYTFSDIGTKFCLMFQKGFLLCCLNFLRVSFRQSVPLHLVRDRTIVFLLVIHLLIEEFGPILYGNLERRLSVSVHWTNLIYLVRLHKLQLHENDHKSNMPPSSESVVFLSTLLFDAYSFSEVHMRREKHFHCRHNHRIKHIVVGEICSHHKRSRCHKLVNWFCFLNFFDPMHCDVRNCWLWTYCSLAVVFPALEFHRVCDFIEDAFPRSAISGDPSYHCENKFLQYDLKVLWLQYPVKNMEVGIDELCGSRLTPLPFSFIFPVIPGPNPQEDDAKFCEFSKRAEDGPSRAGRLSKNVSWSTKSIPCGKRQSESRLGIPLGLGMVKCRLGTWDAPELLAVSGSWNSLASDKEFTLFCGSCIWVKSWLTVVGFLSCCIDNSSILNCLARFAPSQQILRGSSISWRVLARPSQKRLFLISNSPHKLTFSLWAWSAHWFAWCSSNRWDSSSPSVS